MLGVLGQPIADHEVARQLRRSPGRVGRLRQGATRVLGVLVLAQRVADRVALGAQEREAHRAADDQHVGELQEAVDHARSCRPPWRRRRSRRAGGRVAARIAVSVLTSSSSRRPAALGSRCATPSVLAWARWRHAERVVDVDVRELRERRGERRIVASSRPARSARSRAPAPRPRRAPRSAPSPARRRPPGRASRCASVSSLSRSATGASERRSSRRPSGRPRWETSTSLAPRPRSSSIVCSAATIRVSSATTGVTVGVLAHRHVEVDPHEHPLAAHVQVVKAPHRPSPICSSRSASRYPASRQSLALRPARAHSTLCTRSTRRLE